LKGGELDGLQSGWYKNGQKHLELMAKDGKYHGPSTKWYENGQKEGEATFKDGNLDGLATGWHENGQKKIEGNWKDGKKIGIWYEWFNNGQKKSEDDYKDGEGVFGTAFTIRDLALDMLWVNSGTFEMGSPSSEKGRDDEETLHNVTLTDGFYLGKHEVTQAEWAAKRAVVHYPPNAARHSFGTYGYWRSMEWAMLTMGHWNHKTFQRHYVNRGVSKNESDKYFSIIRKN
jgi:formylglycine-generating enzyme required for sulfatase activity